MNYKTVYCFSVIDEVERGKEVYCLDKREKEISKMNDLNLEYALRLINDAKEDDDRYEFWREEKEDA